MALIRGPWPERPAKRETQAQPPEYNPSELLPSWGGDPAHVRRFNHRPPKGFSMKLAENVEVAGISRPETSAAAAAFMRGVGHDSADRDPENASTRTRSCYRLWRAHAGESWRNRSVGCHGFARQIAEVAPIALPRRSGDVPAQEAIAPACDRHPACAAASASGTGACTTG
jgi:hypothetical protein